MHFRHTPALAATVLDGAAIAHGAFFISGTLLPVLAVAAPSRAATVAVIAGAMPVLGSLVPAVLFFVARLRSGCYNTVSTARKPFCRQTKRTPLLTDTTT